MVKIKARIRINKKSKIVVFRTTARRSKVILGRLFSRSLKKLGIRTYIKPHIKYIIEIEILEVKKYDKGKKQNPVSVRKKSGNNN